MYRKGNLLGGDHCQLPPTVKNDTDFAETLKMSLFERLALTGVPPIMLNLQRLAISS